METVQASFDYQIRENLMGEACKDALRLNFDRKLKIEFHGTKVNSDAGLLAYMSEMNLAAHIYAQFRSFLSALSDLSM